MADSRRCAHRHRHGSARKRPSPSRSSADFFFIKKGGVFVVALIFHSLTFTHTHTLSLSHSFNPSLSLTHSFNFSHTLSLTLSIPHTNSLSLSVMHTHTLSLSLFQSLLLSFSLSSVRRSCFRFSFFLEDIQFHLRTHAAPLATASSKNNPTKRKLNFILAASFFFFFHFHFCQTFWHKEIIEKEKKKKRARDNRFPVFVDKEEFEIFILFGRKRVIKSCWC